MKNQSIKINNKEYSWGYVEEKDGKRIAHGGGGKTISDCLEQARKEVTKILGIDLFKEQEPITIYAGKNKHLETYNLYSEEIYNRYAERK